MDPKHLVQLAEVIELGSMSRAALRLNVTQPTLSRNIRVIEDRVGSPVLRRGRYGVTPTAIGERLAEEGRAIARRAAQAGEAIEHWKLGLTGELQVGIGPMLAATIMADFLTRFYTDRWPYSLQVVSENAARLIDSLNKGDLDIAIVPSKLNLHQERLDQDLLFTDRLTIVASAHHPLARAQRRLQATDFEGFAWIETAARSGFFGSTRESLAQIGVNPEAPKLSFSGDIIMVLRVIAQTNALCLAPQRLVSRIPQRPEIVELDVDGDLPRRDIAFWTSKAKRDRPEINHFRNNLNAFLASRDLT